VKREAKWRTAFWCCLLGIPSCALVACTRGETSRNSNSGGAGVGGASGEGGRQGTGGRAAGNGGNGGGGAGSGGKAAGGKGGTTNVPDGSTDAQPPPCTAPKILVYEAPGCNGTSTPVCGLPGVQDACAIKVCACDGTTLSGCGDYLSPFRHKGSCADASASASVPDSGSDAH
jgi:hypothetical protein